MRLREFDAYKKKVTLPGNYPAITYIWIDENKKCAAKFTIFDWWDGKNIENLWVNPKYRGNGLSYQLLDYAVKKLGAKNLAVDKDNYVAKHVYDEYGFKITEEDDDNYYMSI